MTESVQALSPALTVLRMHESADVALAPPSAWGFGPLFDAIKDAVIVADAGTGRILLWNRGAEALFQYTGAEAQELLLEQLVPPAFKQAHLHGLSEYAAHRGGALLDSDSPVEVPAVRKDGVEILIELALSRIANPRDPGGAYAMGIIRDVTRLRESEQTVKLILDATSQPTFALDIEGNCTLANPAAAALLGYLPEELVGQSMHAVMHHSRPDGAPFPVEECPINQTFRAGLAGHVDTEVFWRRDGTAFPADYRSQPIIGGGTLLGAVVAFDDITALKLATARVQERETQLRQRALTDVLTGVGNRRFANEALNDLAVGDAVVMIDIDHFKQVNDTHGHNAGDEVLVALAGHLKAHLRQNDSLARFGGEEFLLVLRGAPPSAQAVVQRMADDWANPTVRTTFSAGVAVHRDGLSPTETLQQADSALYDAKRQGRNRIVQFEPSSA